MSLRETSWEFVVAALSWVVAIVVLCLGGFALVDVARWRWELRAARTSARVVAAVHVARMEPSS